MNKTTGTYAQTFITSVLGCASILKGHSFFQHTLKRIVHSKIKNSVIIPNPYVTCYHIFILYFYAVFLISAIFHAFSFKYFFFGNKKHAG